MKIVGMGNALVDILIRMESDELLNTLHLPKGSMTMIDEDGLLRVLHEIERFDTVMAGGGSAANTMCGLAQLGINCAFIGKTGEDYYGSFYEEDLIRNGVHPHLIKTSISSGCANSFISPEGERTFGTYLGAAAELQSHELTEAMFVGYDWFYVEGYLVFNNPLMRTALTMARKAGCRIALDMASYNVVKANHAFFEEILRDYVDLVFANEEEAKAFTKVNAEQSASILGELCDIAVVKIGKKGSWIVTNGRKIKVEATKNSCIDSTGAGDLYAAGFLYGITKKYSWERCGTIASLLAGKVIEVLGTKLSDDEWERCIADQCISVPK